MAKTKKVRRHDMTLEQFLRHLSRTRNGWYEEKSGELRTKTRSGREHCPITRVAAMHGRGSFDPSEFEEAADAIGLHSNLADRIMYAADDFCFPQGAQKTLRLQLLKAVGLKEAEA